MKKFLLVLLAILLVSAAFAQETTGGMQGTVKDPSGAVVSNATVEVSGAALIGSKKVLTDQSGYFRFANLPAGEYTLSVTAAGFKGLKRSGLKLDTGKLPTIDLNMEVGGTEQTVEVSAAAPLVDVATSKVQTNVSAETLSGIPKGRSFQSVIAFAPGARVEPLQGTTTNGQFFAGYQIDGASNSENSYLIEGQETSDIRTGQTRTNAPFEFIQEVQVKTSGFEAEYGGALGGVVNVIQKRGSNAWHGSLFNYYQGDMFNAAPVTYVRYKPGTSVAALSQFDRPLEYVQPKKDHYRTVEPGFEAGGYLLKDRLWLFASTVPSINNRSRVVNWACTNPSQCPAPGITGPQTFYQNSQTYYSLARVDARITDKIRAFGSWQYAYMKANGIISSGSTLPNADDFFGRANTTNTATPFNYRDTQGFVAPNVVYNAGADITITPNIIATTRFGRNYNDLQDRGLQSGIRYRYLNSNYNYPTATAPAGTNCADPDPTKRVGVCSIDGLPIPSAYIQNGAFSSMGPNTWQFFDKTSRKSFSQDMAWFKKGFGTHNVKVGYAVNRLANNPLNTQNTSQVYVAYNVAYNPNDPASCTAIRAYNLTHFGAAGTAADTSCKGNWGTYNVREVSTVGNVSSLNQAIYFQDAWTMGKGFTVNAGLRMDKEGLPSFKEGAPGINFGFGSKLAPRIGASWDVFRNGKLKAYGSFGYFYDIMKYSLPRGSFGGDYWHDCVYALDDPDFTKIQPAIVGGHFCPGTGGANGATTGRFIENSDFRSVSNDPTNSLIDPKLKPMKQHELVFGTDYAISPKLGLELRYSQKRLDRTIEDSGLLTGSGEIFYIVNPGEGIDKQPLTAADCPLGCPTQPKPNRRYDAVEARLTKTASEKWFGTVSYTWSKLRGNYSGLTSTDLSDGGGGRADANVSRAFDEPYMQFDAHGKVIDGPLATDRTHTFKGFGYYKIKWMHMESLLGFTQQWFSGTPYSSYLSIAGAPVFAENRGQFINVTQNAAGVWSATSFSERRSSAFSQTDFNFVHELKVSKTNEAMRLGFEANVLNLFNQKAVLDVDQNMLAAGKLATDYSYQTLMTGYDYIKAANDGTGVLNSGYGKPNIFQDGRVLRFKVKFTF